jgi:hypothetical protein
MVTIVRSGSPPDNTDGSLSSIRILFYIFPTRSLPVTKTFLFSRQAASSVFPVGTRCVLWYGCTEKDADQVAVNGLNTGDV